jgi:hypothetical protein
MSTIQFNGQALYYCITDSGDGSASLQLFKNQDALDLYLEKMEENGDYGDLSEGGGAITQNCVDTAMDEEAVIAEFGDE